ncbi:hypothetical protein CJ030_MR3G026355 [Morella rubra]|uniref:Uncharacterized protein n=1 Tax=Morella rubra TaxID=262757 RepID=A0A6A1W068_9ROSI|nr:hypothetical protein CJ030_MR3G026355 [Morella rubra]
MHSTIPPTDTDRQNVPTRIPADCRCTQRGKMDSNIKINFQLTVHGRLPRNQRDFNRLLPSFLMRLISSPDGTNHLHNVLTIALVDKFISNRPNGIQSNSNHQHHIRLLISLVDR